jgi:hypothetical protein
MAPAALSLIAVTFTEPRERARAFGVFGAISVEVRPSGWSRRDADRVCVVALVLGVNVPIALAACGRRAARSCARARRPGDTKYDVPGAVSRQVGLVFLVYGFSEAAKPDIGWTAGSTFFFLTAAVVLWSRS